MPSRSIPQISSNEYRHRRKRALRALGRDAVMILPAAREQRRNRDVHFPFRQDSDFQYLTGFPEPEAIAVFVPKRKEGEFLLFCRPRDPERELWDGRRAGVDGAIANYGADQAFALEELDEQLPDLLAGRRRIVYPLGRDDELDAQVLHWLRQVQQQVRGGVRAPSELVSSDDILHEQRLFKSPAEQGLMRQAARISAEGHRQLMRHAGASRSERDLETLFHYSCAQQGARFQAYPPIVGAGENACILHYIENDAPLRPGQLVLIDAGGELDGYASDITRTFPVDGCFSEPQRRLYQLVLDAQLAAIKAVRPGKSFNAPHKAAVRVLTQGLVELGLIQADGKSLPELIKEEAYKPFFMHRTGHWLGMDVHDVGAYKVDGKWRKLAPGMVLTIEPGLYVATDAQVPAEFRGIGIRIEDDVLVTEQGHEVLSRDVPKEIQEIERLMSAAAGKTPGLGIPGIAPEAPAAVVVS